MKSNRSFVEIIKSLVILICGIFIMSIGVAMARLAGLGTSPISSIPNVLSMFLPLTIGQLTIVFMVVFILLEWVVLRSEFSQTAWLQLVPGILFGVFIDLCVKLFSWVPVNNYLERVIVTLISIVILSLGVYLEINSHAVVMPGEGISMAIAVRFKQKFPKVKVWADATMVLTAVIISLLALHGFVGVREGSIVAALITGRLVDFYTEFLPGFTAWMDPEM